MRALALFVCLSLSALGCTKSGDAVRERPSEARLEGAATNPAAERSPAEQRSPESSDRSASPVSAPFALVELFTSEGCSSCPPADRNLMRLAERAAVSGERLFVASFHVDYWNDLGWKDPFSDHRYSARQWDYGRVFGQRGVYTPQIVVSGMEELVGSKVAATDHAVARAFARQPTAGLTLASRVEGERVLVRYETRAASPSELAVTLLQARAEVSVLRGENRGTTGTHVNVVRGFESRVVAARARGDVALRLPQDLPRGDARVLGWLADPTTRAVEAAELSPIDGTAP